MKLTDEVINDIRSSANIVDVIGHYIPLFKKGKGYTAVCPFHDDHDPSLSISEDKQIYKCFVCGNGGNAFTFVSNFKKCSFPEAVVEVSNIIGKPIQIDTAPKKVDKNQKYYDVLTSMVTYSNYLLTGSKLGEKPMEYLNNRGLEKEVIDYFNIGYNPEDNKMYAYLNKQGYKDEDILKTGVVRLLDKGMADVFYKRILFPIHNRFGNPIAFSARDYLGTSDSKYINSNETIIYTKGDNLYNYHRAKDACRKQGYVIVCEGVMDVIAYYRAGKENVVATLGTACTKTQIELLKSLSNHIVLSYDGDNAGQHANLKIGEMLLDEKLKVSVIDNKTNLDPDEIISKGGKNALRDLETKKISYIDFAINYYKKHYNLDNYDDRKQMTIKVSELIDKLDDEYDRLNFQNELTTITKISKISTTKVDKKAYNNKGKIYKYSIDGLTKAEYLILSQMALSSKATSIYQSKLGYLLGQTNQQLAMLIIDEYRKYDKCSLSRIYDESQDEAIKNNITSLALVEGLPIEYDEESLNAAINKVIRETKSKKLEVLKEKINENSLVDPETANVYLKEYMELVKELSNNG
ncbi:MAG: DNA primase [Erysipelotrichaceae bacterium]|nr:DNA primase [Erysipelotrichaceae bacterium]